MGQQHILTMRISNGLLIYKVTCSGKKVQNQSLNLSDWLKGVDGGPDENPRFEKNIIMGCKTFRDFDLDCLIEVTNAPGLSAYNRAERRMYPLSKELTGVVLPYDKFGSHLDASGKTIDEELEVKNFQAAGEVLADIWHEMEIDGQKVTAEFIQKKVNTETAGFKVSPMFRNALQEEPRLPPALRRHCQHCKQRYSAR